MPGSGRPAVGVAPTSWVDQNLHGEVEMHSLQAVAAAATLVEEGAAELMLADEEGAVALRQTLVLPTLRKGSWPC